MKKKGEKGYISSLKTYDLVFILASVIICAGIFIYGIKTAGSKANIFTVISVCLLLPACKRLTNLIVVFPYKGIKNEDYEKIVPVIKEGWDCFCDMIFTTEDHVLKFNHCVLADNYFVAYSDMDAEKNKYIKEYLEKGFDKRGSSVHVTVCTELQKYLNILMNTVPEGKCENEYALSFVRSLMV